MASTGAFASVHKREDREGGREELTERKGREKGYISYPVDLCPLLGPE